VAGKMFGGLSRGGPLVYEDVPDAKLLGDDWVIVETRYCGICGSDVKQAYLEGAFDNPMTAVISFPHVLGHEVVGTVVEAGKDVRHVKKGDRVACYPWITCAVRVLPLCAACAAGDLALCQSFTGGRFSAGIHHGTCRDLSGGFATHMPAHESACFAIPSDVTFEEAALADPFSVCLHAVHKAPPRRGETVIVVGCGALGMLLIHLVSRLYPGVTIWGVDVHASQREKAVAIGATDFFSLPPRELYDRAIGSLERLDRRWRTLTPEDLGRRGLHPRLGEMTIAEIADRFVVAHLEDHVAQLDAILRDASPGS